MPNIDYSKIYYKEKKSTGERVGENAFYMSKYPDEPDELFSYKVMDLFGLETKKIVPLSDSEMDATNW
jgi:hypothetical protein